MPTNANHITPYFWLILIAFVVALLTRRAKVPYALALVITGLVIGIPRLLPQAHLDPNVLFTIFLPPLLFESALNLRLVPLRRDWKPICIYTLAGTVASTFIVGGLTSRAIGISVPAGLVFGALISTTDPISVIAIFRRLGAGKRLSLIMEAESLFNNDAAVVLFTVMMGAVSGRNVSLSSGLWEFVRLMCGGALLGSVYGALASRVHYELDDHLVEITLTSVAAFGSYLSAEAIHVSGVMAVVTAGLVIGNYGMQNAMSPGTRLAVTAFWEYAAFVVNSIVFLLIGIEVAYVRWQDKVGLALLAVGAVLAGRAAIYPISWVVNRLRGEIPLSWQHILFWGGLRGALSMALVLGLDRSFPQRDTLVAGTFGVVLFSLLIQGSTVGLLLQRLGLSNSPADATTEERRIATELIGCRAALFELDRIRAQETYPNWTVELLTRRYQTQAADLEIALQRLNPDHETQQTDRTNAARQRVLSAEKSAFQEAERQGWLTERDWSEIATRLDHELDTLLKIPDKQ